MFSYAMFQGLGRGRCRPVGDRGSRRLRRQPFAGQPNAERLGGHSSPGPTSTVLGVQPALGRLLTPSDDQALGEHFVAVLSHAYWEEHLGSDPGVLNQTIIVNGVPMTIVGVSPKGFEGTTLGSSPDVLRSDHHAHPDVTVGSTRSRNDEATGPTCSADSSREPRSSRPASRSTPSTRAS